MADRAPLLRSLSTSNVSINPVSDLPLINMLNANPAANKLQISITDYVGVERLYKSLEDLKIQDRFRDVTTLSIHLQEFKRPIFQVIDESEFDIQIQSETSTSRTTRLSSKSKWRSFMGLKINREQKVANMISTILQNIPHLEVLDIMLFSRLNFIDPICPKVVKLVISAGYFDEFARFLKLCKEIKIVKLDGIIPRLTPEDMETEGYMTYSNSLDSHSIELLNITRRSVITEMQFLTILKGFPNLSNLYYSKFANYLPDVDQRIVKLSKSVISEEKFVRSLRLANNLKVLSFYVDERENPKFGVLTSLNQRVKRNLKMLLTTSRLCPPIHLGEFTSLLHVTLWWTEYILPPNFQNPLAMIGSPLHHVETLPRNLGSIHLYFSKEALQHEALQLAEDQRLDQNKADQMYADNLSRIFETLIDIIGVFRLSLLVIPHIVPIDYYQPHEPRQFTGLGKTREGIYNSLLPLLNTNNN